MAATIYLHWAATPYTWQRSGLYHSIISGDGRVMHDNYGPVIWGGTGERWDLLQLEKGGPPTGGEQLRAWVQQILRGEAGQVLEGSPATEPAPEPLQFVRAASIEARGSSLATQIDSNDTSWAHAAELLDRYDIPYDWDADHRRLLIGALDVVPLCLDDAVQASVGWPLFEMALQHGNAPVILRGILRAVNGEPTRA